MNPIDTAGELSAEDLAAARPAALLLVGRVVHERLRPVRHRFAYPVFCVRCNLARLAELDSWWFGIDRWGPLSLFARDHGPRDGSDLDAWMRARLADAAMPCDGEIWLQTFPRVFGYAFNPVSFWFCHDRAGSLRALFAEVRNTFGERHGYLLGADDGGPIAAHSVLVCRKVLHVSPFCKVEGTYAFRVRDSREASAVSIDYLDDQGLLIHTALGARITALTRANALGALARQPWLTVLVTARIYWQALRLLIKKVPFYGKHPAHGAPSFGTCGESGARHTTPVPETSSGGAAHHRSPKETQS
jgi:DUF1365 family protein